MLDDDDDDEPATPTVTPTAGPTIGETGAPPGTPLPRLSQARLDLPARYEVGPIIKAGGMGIVYRARDTQMQRPIALKIFKASAEIDPLREARLTALLAHPNIMPIYDAGQMSNGEIWQSMQLIEGRDLSAVLADRSVGLRRMIDLLVRVAQAMAYAHALGIVHGDLKPANIRVDSYDRVFVLDWGISARAGAQGSGHFTRGYASPEQLAGDVVTPGFDVFALGKLLEDILARADNADPEADPLYALSARCVGAPTLRPKTGKAIADALQAWMDGAQRRTEAEALVAQADAHLTHAAANRAEADDATREADTLLAALKPSADWRARRAPWALEDQAAAKRIEAEQLALQAEQLLQAALRRCDRLPSALARLEEMHTKRLMRAEALGDAARINEITARLRALETPTADALLNRMGRFSLASDPGEARVWVAPFELRDRRWVAGEEVEIGTTPLVLERPPGRYRVRLIRAGHAPVVLPVRLERGGQDRGIAPGETTPHAITLPTGLAETERYVPAGWFQSGGDPIPPESLPERAIWVDGFAIETFPLTYRRFVEALNTLCATGQADRAAAMAHLPSTHDDHACLGRDAEGRYTAVSISGADVLDWPVTQISWNAARAWAALRAEQTGQPWRLPDELEREKAARGTDGRIFPWGDYFEPTWACIAEGRAGALTRGSVFDWPLDVSVYDVRGLAGNVRDWCLNRHTKTATTLGDRLVVTDPCAQPQPDALRVIRGGYYGGREILARAAARFAGDPNSPQGYQSTGVRLVRSI